MTTKLKIGENLLVYPEESKIPMDLLINKYKFYHETDINEEGQICTELKNEADKKRIHKFLLEATPHIQSGNITLESGKNMYNFNVKEGEVLLSKINPFQRETVFSSQKEDWETDPELFAKLNSIFEFKVDVCANEKNKKLDNYYSPEKNGLIQDWKAENGPCWCNPPYGRKIGKWTGKGWEEAQRGTQSVFLIAARTETLPWFNHIHGKADAILFFKGRLDFVGADDGAPFPSALVMYNLGDIVRWYHEELSKYGQIYYKEKTNANTSRN